MVCGDFMKFPYKRYHVISSTATNSIVVSRPVIPICVIGPGDMVDIFALADTGADETILPRSVGELIGAEIDDTAQSRVTGISGHQVAVAPGTVEIEITDGQETYRWSTQVSFISFYDPNDEVAVLGHRGCLDFLTATFDGNRRTLDLVANTKFPGNVQS